VRPHAGVPIALLATALAATVLFAGTAAAQPDVVGRWSSAAPLPYFPVHTHLLPSGQVMIWPGDAQGTPPGVSGNDPRRWDPATGQVTALSKPGYDIFCTGHAFTADGQLLVAGGHIANNVGEAKARLYNPATDAWTTLPDMNAGRWYPTVTTLNNGDLLVVSGNVDTTVGVNRLPQVFQAANRTWRSLTNAQLAQDLYPMMLLAPNGKVFNPGPSATTRYLDPRSTGAWTVVGTRLGGYRDYGSAVVYDDGKVLVMGGGDPPASSAEVIDLNAPSPAWRAVGSMQFARRQLNAVLLPDGRVLVTGGTSSPGFNDPTGAVLPAELWDPATEQWTVLASATVPRVYHSATLLLPDGRVLSTGGNGHTEVEIFEPPYLFKGARPTISSAPASVSYGKSFFVGTPDATNVTAVTWLRLSSVTHAFNQNQRINRLAFTPTSGGLNVVAPASSNLAPPGHYLLFLLNSAGVPSIAKVVQITGTATAPATLTLRSLSPASAAVGGQAFTLTATGTGFASGATVMWNGVARPTTFVSSTQVTAAIPASDIAAAGTASVTVAVGTAVSNAEAFTVTGGGGGAAPATYVSDLAWTSATNGWGPVERDTSNGEDAAGDGHIISLRGATYAKGLGVHANSEVVYDLAANYTTFLSDVGVDDEVGGRGSVVFQVWVDGVKLYDSGVLTGASPVAHVSVDVTGKSTLRLVVTDAGDNNFFDHSDWAGARLTGATTPAPPVLSALSPASATAGGPAFTLTATGTGFASGATVMWNGAARTTTVVSSTQVTAAIPASDITAAGTASVTVAVGAAVSNALAFTITAGGGGTGSTTYLSDLAWTSATNGWGPVERDTSNGEDAAGDGHVISLRGVTYTKGLGVHASSEVVYALGGNYTRLLADVGVDDEVGGRGSVVFQVWVDGVKLYDSGVLTGTSPVASVSVDVTGKSTLRLVVTDAGDNNFFDHSDWAGARLTGP
jgi:hypothetical protein